MGISDDNLFYGLRKGMTDEQEYFVNSVIDYNVVFSNAQAGSGKTLMAFASLYYLYQKGEIDEILYIFSPVEEDKMGFRPGTQREKEDAYIDPLKQAMAKIGVHPDRALDEKSGFVKVKSHTFLRGVNQERKGIILDEAQNYKRFELKKSLSRVHDDCHLVVIGHTGQIDLKFPSESGFEAYLNHYAKLKDRVRVCPLTHNFRGWISRHADTLDD